MQGWKNCYVVLSSKPKACFRVNGHSEWRMLHAQGATSPLTRTACKKKKDWSGNGQECSHIAEKEVIHLHIFGILEHIPAPISTWSSDTKENQAKSLSVAQLFSGLLKKASTSSGRATAPMAPRFWSFKASQGTASDRAPSLVEVRLKPWVTTIYSISINLSHSLHLETSKL